MARCIYCDCCDTAGSISTTNDRARGFQYDTDEKGFVCAVCRSVDYDEETLDEEFDEEI